MIWWGILLVAAVLIGGCAPVRHMSNTEQPLGQAITVGVGDVVLRLNKYRNLQNAFGRADIFGRKTYEGFSEVRFAGVEKNGDVVLYRKDVHIVTNETTMSRSPVSSTTAVASTQLSGSYYGDKRSGTLNATGRTTNMSTTVMSSSDYHIALPSDTIPIRLSPGNSRILIEGYTTEILKATPVSLEYRIVECR